MVLNTVNYGYGVPFDSEEWRKAKLTLLFGGGPVRGLMSYVEAKDWQEVLRKTETYRRVNLQKLDGMREADLMGLFYSGLAWIHLNEYDKAVACLHLVYSQAPFRDKMVMRPIPFAQFPDKALAALTMIAEEKGEQFVKDFPLQTHIKSISSGGGGCFIATAATGSTSSYEVQILTVFRDGVLMRSHLGRVLVRIYYMVSPPIARLLDLHPALRRSALGGIVRPAAAWCRHWLSSL